MKKILYITSFLPYDTPFAGSKTSYRILGKISDHYKIHLLSFSTEVEDVYIQRFNSFCKDAKNIKLVDVIKITKTSRIKNAIIFFFLPAFLVARFNFNYFFSRLLNKIKYDIIFVDWSQSIIFGYLLSRILHVNVIYSVADIISQSLERKLKQNKSILKRMLYGFEYFKTSYLENKILNTGKLVIVQSQKDKNLLVNMGVMPKKILVISPYYNQDMVISNTSHYQETFNILYWGAMNRVENIDAVEYYLMSIHETIKKQIPNYKFIIAGANPPKSLLESYKNDKYVHITGFIDNPSDVFNISHISVAPLRLGAGIKVKTLESLYMGLPTIATSIGAEGIDLDEKDGLYVSDDTAEFTEKILQLYERRNLVDRNKIHENVKHAFDFDKSLDEIIDKIKDTWRPLDESSNR